MGRFINDDGKDDDSCFPFDRFESKEAQLIKLLQQWK